MHGLSTLLIIHEKHPNLKNKCQTQESNPKHTAAHTLTLRRQGNHQQDAKCSLFINRYM